MWIGYIDTMPRPLGIEFAELFITSPSEGILFDIRYADGIIPVLPNLENLFLMAQGLDKPLLMRNTLELKINLSKLNSISLEK